MKDGKDKGEAVEVDGGILKEIGMEEKVYQVKRLPVDELEVGMVLGISVTNSSGNIIIPANTILIKEHIELLKDYGTSHVFIDAEKRVSPDEALEAFERREIAPPEKKKVLIVDDSPPMRRTLRLLIEQLDFIEVVGEADSGKLALDMARELKPDIITMDMNLPVMDGIAATKQIKAILKDVKIVMVTSNNEIDFVKSALLAGVSDYIIKPFSPRRVVGVICKHALFKP